MGVKDEAEISDVAWAPSPVAPSWAAVYEAHASRLQRLAVVLVGPADSHDLVIDAVTSAVHSPNWSEVASHGGYLTRSLIRLSEERRRSTTRRERREARFALESGRRPDELDVERSLVVGTALRSLSATQLAVVHLHYWEDLTLDEVAAHLGIGVGTTRTHLARAKRRLLTVLPTTKGDR